MFTRRVVNKLRLNAILSTQRVGDFSAILHVTVYENALKLRFRNLYKHFLTLFIERLVFYIVFIGFSRSYYPSDLQHV